MVKMFIEGGIFMYPILACLILGIMFAIERAWNLSRASINTKKFMLKIREALEKGGDQEAMEVCAHTRGPIASIFHAGLLRKNRGIDQVEKAIITAGSIEMAFLEKNLVWLSLFISVAPMLGFLGTVSGMIRAFKDIAAANDISPAIVASGISEALLTTMFGLAVAILVQFFHNMFVARVDKLVIDMEESSYDFVDTLVAIEENQQAASK
jgi:biopolymer transport protein ExbB